MEILTNLNFAPALSIFALVALLIAFAYLGDALFRSITDHH